MGACRRACRGPVGAARRGPVGEACRGAVGAPEEELMVINPIGP